MQTSVAWGQCVFGSNRELPELHSGAYNFNFNLNDVSDEVKRFELSKLMPTPLSPFKAHRKLSRLIPQRMPKM